MKLTIDIGRRGGRREVVLRGVHLGNEHVVAQHCRWGEHNCWQWMRNGQLLWHTLRCVADTDTSSALRSVMMVLVTATHTFTRCDRYVATMYFMNSRRCSLLSASISSKAAHWLSHESPYKMD